MTRRASPQQLAGHQFVSLDGLRGVAAILILIFHAPDMTLRNLLPGSYLAVDLFFVLSGFILARVYQGRFDNGMSPREFIALRLARLYPLYLLGTFGSLALLAGRLALNPDMVAPAATTVLGALFFLPTFDRSDPALHLYALNFPAWSLFFEIVINIGFALVARHLTDRRLAAIMAVGAVMLVATSVYFGSLSTGMAWPNAVGGLGRVCYTFFAGVAVERAWQRGLLPRIAISPLVAAAVVVVLFATPLGPWRAGYDALVALVVLPLLILGAARREPAGRVSGVFAAIGTGSYALYMLHAPIRDWLITVVPRLTGHEFASYGVAGTMALLVAVLAAAMIVDRAYDRPVRGWLARLVAAPRERVATVATARLGVGQLR